MRAVWKCGEPVDPAELREETGLSQTRLLSAVSRLEEVGALEVLPGGEVIAVAEAEAADPAAVASEAAQAQEHRRAFERSCLEMMRGYAETGACRREYLLSYFGEPYTPPCGNCDRCDAGLSCAAVAGENLPLAVGSRVAHPTFGEGQVVRYEGEKVTVLFDEQGYQTLALPVVLENELLKPLPA